MYVFSAAQMEGHIAEPEASRAVELGSLSAWGIACSQRQARPSIATCKSCAGKGPKAWSVEAAERLQLPNVQSALAAHTHFDDHDICSQHDTQNLLLFSPCGSPCDTDPFRTRFDFLFILDITSLEGGRPTLNSTSSIFDQEV